MADPITITALLTYLGGVTTGGILGGIADRTSCSIFKKCYDRAKPLWKKGELPKNAHLLRAVNTAHLNATAYFIKAVAKELHDRGEVQYASNLKLSFADWAKHEKDIIENAPDAEIEHNNPIYKDIEKLLAASNNPTVKELRKELAEICKQDLLKKLPEQIGGSARAKGLVGFTLPDCFETMLRDGWDEGGKTTDWFDVLTLEFATILKDEEGKNPTVKEAFKDRLLSDVKVDTTEIINILEQQVASIVEIKKELVAVKQWLEGIGVKIDAVKEDTEEIKNITTDTNERLKRLEALLLKGEGEQSEEIKHALYTSEEVKELIEKLIKLEQEGKNYAAIEEVKKELEQIRDNVERLSETFKNIDLAKASERLKKANTLFKEGEFKEVRKLLEEEERVQERARILEEHKTIEQQRKNLADEDLVHAQSILLDTDDPNRFEEAEKAFESSVDIYPNYNNHFEYALYLSYQNQYDAAIEQFKHALAYVGKDEVKRGIVLNNLGNLYRDNNNPLAATNAYEESLKIRRHLSSYNRIEYYYDVAEILNNWGNLHQRNNDIAAAKNAYQESLQILRQLAAVNSAIYEPHVAMVLNNLGFLYYIDKNLVAAAVAFEECLIIRRRLAVDNPSEYEPELSSTLNNLGVLHHKNNVEEAEDAYKECLTIRRKFAKTNPSAYEPNLAMTLNNLGALYQENNNVSAALEAFEECLAIYKRLAVENPYAYEPGLAMTLNNIGVLYTANNNVYEASITFNECLLLRRKLAAYNPAAYEPELALTLFNISKLHQQNDSVKIAIETLEECVMIRRKFAAYNPAAYEPELASTIQSLWTLYYDYDNKAASDLLKEFVILCKKLSTSNPMSYLPQIGNALILLGNTYDDDLAAISAFEESLMIHRELVAANPDTYAYYVLLALSLSSLVAVYKNEEQLRASYQEAFEIYRRLSTTNPDVHIPDLARTIATFGSSLIEIGKNSEAKMYLTNALSIYKDLSSRNPPMYQPYLEMIEEELKGL